MFSEKSTIRRLTCAAFYLTALFAGGGSSARAATLITTADEMLAATSPGGAGDRVLDDDEYVIPAGSAINFLPNILTIDNAASSLTADNTGRGGVLLQVRQLFVSDGKVYATGGNTGSAHGISAQNGYTQSGGMVAAWGGAGSLASGIHVNAGGYAHSGGTLTATGSALRTNTSAVRVTNGGFSQSGGDITAHGGSITGVNQSYGIWITGTGEYVQDGGSLTAHGGAGNQNYGVYTQNSVRIEDGALLTATGGTGDNASGMLVYGNVTQNGGDIALTAGGNYYANGMYVRNGTYTMNSGTLKANANNVAYNDAFGLAASAFVQNGGSIEAKGGDSSRSRGVQITGTFTQNGGAITATGGGYSSSHAFYAATFNMNNNGVITADGGAGANSRGLYAGVFNMNGGDVTASAGSENGAYGMYATTLNQTGGTVTAEGAADDVGNAVAGLYAGTYSLRGGDLDAAGGDGTNSHGVMATTMTKTGGTLDAVGGSGVGSHGVHAVTFNLEDADITATAGRADKADGLYADTFNHNGGTVEASGSGTGIAGAASGLRAETYNLRSGVLNAAGGDGGNSRGMTATALEQSGGTLTATGGGAADAYGLYVEGYRQTSGTLTARGGATDANGHGVLVATQMDIAHELRLERQGDAASVYLQNDAKLVLESASTLTPVVDLTELMNLKDDSTGLILGAADGTTKVTIYPGANMRPFFTNTRQLRRASDIYDIPFIDLKGGVIGGVFADEGVQRGLFIGYTIKKIGNDKYVFQVEYEGEVIEEVPNIPCENSKVIIGIIDGILTRDPGVAALNHTWDVLENSRDRQDWAARAAHVGKTMSPQAYMKFTHSLIRMADLTQSDFFRGMGTFPGRRETAGAEGAECCPTTPRPRDWTVWASPLYQRSSRFETTCMEFERAKEKHFGFSVGAARRFGALSLGVAAHSVRTDYKASYSDIDADSVGFVAGGRLEAPASGGGWFNPRLDFSFSYARSSLDQRNLGYDYLWRKSSPRAHTYRGHITAANRLELGRRFAITPEIGIEYTHVRQSGYRDRGRSEYLFAVSKGGYDSIRPVVGVGVEALVTDRLTLTARGRVRYETKDRRASFGTESTSFAGVEYTARGEDRKGVSGMAGVGLRYAVGDRMAASLNYDLLLEDKYAAHRFEAGIGIAF